MTVQPRVLILAGTAEARELASRLADLGSVDVIASLAGATVDPKAYRVKTKVGGFGGIEGLTAWLIAEHISVVIDATHPFASTMSRNAAMASASLQMPLIRFERPAWEPGPDDKWSAAESLPDALEQLPRGARAFFATGKGTIEHLEQVGVPRRDVWCAIRVIDRPERSFPLPLGTFIAARPPFTLADEIRTLRELEASHLVAKNAGGAFGRSKLLAARQLGLPIIMVKRPAPPAAIGYYHQTIEDVIEQLVALV
ncbi:MAG: cobalt-precorrin-6A reductase [Cohaesibacteraceae bacterium]